MRRVIYTADMPRRIDDFAIDWAEAVVSHAPISIERTPYLDAIGRYSNITPVSLGVFAHRFVIANDSELDRALGLTHALGTLASELPAALLARTRLREALTGFARDATVLEERVREAKLEWLSPFLLEGTLASYLYGYGMYRFFQDDHDAATAVAHTRSLLASTTRSPLEAIVPLWTRLPWGDWFDVHSCTDLSMVLVDRQTREGALFAFSHSD